MSNEPLALYFGRLDVPGHYLHGCERGERAPEGFPWDVNYLDGGHLRAGKVPDQPDGVVRWVVGGKPVLWFGFFWWDRSGDSRGNSGSGFWVRGFGPAEITRASVIEAAPRAFAFACERWPQVVARQHHPLKLKTEPGPDARD